MPGPKMGPRPPDFDEEVIRQSPTFLKWTQLEIGEKLRYACREFVRGQPTDEERLMRRIMIARRNNLRDHETLKRARKQQEIAMSAVAAVQTNTTITARPDDLKPKAVNNDSSSSSIFYNDGDFCRSVGAIESNPRKRRPPSAFSDAQVVNEMDVAAVEATRSYRAWMSLENGAEFVYNQKYIKGKEGHDWLLRKNIWRRMRYRRENKRMVEKMKTSSVQVSVGGIRRQKMELEQQSRSPVTLQLTTQQHHLINNINTSQQVSADAMKKYQANTIMPMVSGIAPGAASASMVTDFKSINHNNGTNMSATEAATSSSAVAAAAAAVASNHHANSISGTYDVSNVEKAAVEAAVAAAESYVNSHPDTGHTILQASQIGNNSAVVNANGTSCDTSHTTLNDQQLEVAAHNAALDAAAKLAAATTESATADAMAAAAAVAAASVAVAARAVEANDCNDTDSNDSHSNSASDVPTNHLSLISKLDEASSICNTSAEVSHIGNFDCEPSHPPLLPIQVLPQQQVLTKSLLVMPETTESSMEHSYQEQEHQFQELTAAVAQVPVIHEDVVVEQQQESSQNQFIQHQPIASLGIAPQLQGGTTLSMPVMHIVEQTSTDTSNIFTMQHPPANSDNYSVNTNGQQPGQHQLQQMDKNQEIATIAVKDEESLEYNYQDVRNSAVINDEIN